MSKNCINCSAIFKTTDADKSFYEKLSVSEPSHCPKCRAQRRMAWRNDRTFYQRKCDKTGEIFVSTYAPDAPYPIYKPSAWYGESWNALDYGRDFDFTKSFFENFADLMRDVPRLGIDIVGCENSDYCNYCGYDRNCYLDIAGENNEDCYFNLFVKSSKNCADCTFVYESQLCYQAINCYNCYNVRFSSYLENCNDCYFCFDMKGCSDCLFSSNQRQKQYMIFNEQHTKEQYEEKLAQLNLGSRAKLKAYIQNWKQVMQKSIHRDMYILNCQDVSGNNVKNSKNCQSVFNVLNSEDSKYLYDVLDAKDCYDLNYSLFEPEVSYELISTLEMKFSAFSMATHHSNNVFYADMCNNSADLFGCISLRRSQYCILNKQYSKEDYEALRARIVEHMKSTGDWGEFFPVQLSPHAYNATVAQEYYPLARAQAIAKGYKWQDKNSTEYQLASCKVPDDIADVEDSIIDEVLACDDCGKNYKIIVQELRFYKQQGLPIPHQCPDCRHLSRMHLRTPRSLWQRECSKCNKRVKTPYSPKRSEQIYCEQCYQSELY